MINDKFSQKNYDKHDKEAMDKDKQSILNSIHEYQEALEKKALEREAIKGRFGSRFGGGRTRKR